MNGKTFPHSPFGLIVAIVVTAIMAALTANARAAPCELPGEKKFTSLQWSLCNLGQPFRIRSDLLGVPGKVGADIQLSSAWQIVDSAPNIVVAVIDSGFDLQHPELASTYLLGKQFSFLQESGKIPKPDSLLGVHGNLVAGIIGANGKNSAGITGIAREVRILPIQTVPLNGAEEKDEHIAAAILYAVRSGAKVINCSFGKYHTSDVVKAAIQFALVNDVLIVASAGNGTKDVENSPHWPSSYSESFANVISVAATDRRDELWERSNFGASIDIAAPGDEILSTGWFSADPFHHFFSASGTSMAAAHVSGVAALMLQMHSAMKPAEIKSILRATANRLPTLAGKVASGRLDAAAALWAVQNLVAQEQKRNNCELAPTVRVGQAGLSGHSTIWEFSAESRLRSELFAATDEKLAQYKSWVLQNTPLSSWENLALGLSIVNKAKRDFSPADPIQIYLDQAASIYQKILGGLGRIRKTNCLESLLLRELLNVTNLIHSPAEFSAYIFRRGNERKILGNFFDNGSRGSFDSKFVQQEFAQLNRGGWQLETHIHNHPFDFGPGRSGEIGGRLAPSAVDLATYLELRPQRVVISNGLESLELTLAEIQSLAPIPQK